MSKEKQLPDRWRKTEIGKCVYSMKSGLSRLLSDIDIGLPMLRSSNIGDKYPIFENLKYWHIDDPQGANTKNYVLLDGDLLVNFINSISQIGKSCIFKNLIGRNCIYTTNILRLVTNQKISNEYLFFVMQTEKYNWYIRAITKPAVNQASFTTKDLKKFSFSLPPLPEQKAIADLLSAWDEAIEKTKRMIQVKEKYLRQTARWLLFGHKRLNNQPVKLADGRFFKYPCDWDLGKVSKIAKEVSERNGESEETVLSCSKYDGFVNSLDYFGKQVFSSDTSNYKVIRKGQFGYPSNHVEEGSIGLLEHCEKGIVSPIYIVFEVSKDKVHPLYLFKLLKTDIFKHIFQVCTSSSVDRRGSLRWGEFSKIKIPLPSLQEQQQIAETLSTAQQEIDLLKQLANKYRTQKRGLMQKMLTGTWRVKPEILNKYKEA